MPWPRGCASALVQPPRHTTCRRRGSTCKRRWGRRGRVGLNPWFMADVTVPSSSPTGGSISDLDITTEQVTASSARSMAPVTDAVRDASGAAGLGYLVGLVDVNTAMVGLCASQPDWTATADLMIHEAA